MEQFDAGHATQHQVLTSSELLQLSYAGGAGAATQLARSARYSQAGQATLYALI